MSFCLDSWAVLRWLEGTEPAASRVEEVLAGRPVMSWINLGEVHYITIRRAGEETADHVVRTVRRAVVAVEASSDRVLAASRVKAVFPMALADAFAVSTAMEHRAVLLTGDPEIIDGGGPWETMDLR